MSAFFYACRNPFKQIPCLIKSGQIFLIAGSEINVAGTGDYGICITAIVSFSWHDFTGDFSVKVFNYRPVINVAEIFFVIRIVFFKFGLYHGHRTGILTNAAQNFSGVGTDHNLRIIREIQAKIF